MKKSKSITVDQYRKQLKESFKKFIKDHPDPDKLVLDTKMYPLLVKLGVIIHRRPVAHVKLADLMFALKQHKINQELFHKYFGIQTCPIEGLFPSDCESVLERIINKRLTGTQLCFD